MLSNTRSSIASSRPRPASRPEMSTLCFVCSHTSCQRLDQRHAQRVSILSLSLSQVGRFQSASLTPS